jgi:acyl carrier protein
MAITVEAAQDELRIILGNIFGLYEFNMTDDIKKDHWLTSIELFELGMEIEESGVNIPQSELDCCTTLQSIFDIYIKYRCHGS